MARFLQLTDLHVVSDGALASRVLDTRSILTTAIDRLIDMRAALNPLDAVLVTGDVSDDGSADSYEFARAQLERLGLPILPIPGNHDARAPFRTAFADLVNVRDDGLLDWATTIGDTRIIGLDTLVEGQGGGRLRRESLNFLATELSGADFSAMILMLHHPPIRTGIRFMDTIGVENAIDLESVLSTVSYDVTVLSGHVHGTHVGRIGRHSVFTAPSICSAFALDRREDAPVGFFAGPTGCAVVETGECGLWSAVPLDYSDGPHAF